MELDKMSKKQLMTFIAENQKFVKDVFMKKYIDSHLSVESSQMMVLAMAKELQSYIKYRL